MTLKSYQIAFLLVFLVPLMVPAQGTSSSLDGLHLYSPAVNLERSELEMLRSAKISVDVAMYSFTDREIAAELIALGRPGVKVRVYRDRTEYEHELERSDANTTAMLQAAGIEVRIQGQRTLCT